MSETFTVVIIQDMQQMRQNNATTQNDAKCVTNETLIRYSHSYDIIGTITTNS